MESIKKSLLFCCVFIFCCSLGFAQTGSEYTKYNGKNIQEVQIKTKRIDADIVKKKFLLKEGQTFDEQKFTEAQEKLHNMRIFKKLSFDIELSGQDDITIKIDGEDGAYFFPLGFVTGGAQQGFGLTFVEGNYFKKGEMLYLFFGMGDNGEMLNLGASVNDYFASIKFENLNFHRRFYQDNWVSAGGLFSSEKDKEKFSDPIREDYNNEDKFSVMFAKNIDNLTLFVRPEYYYIDSSSALDNGTHSTLSIGASYQKNMRQGVNFGALMGYGLSDKENALKDLKARKLGFMLASSLKQGYAWTGSSYKIIKLSLDSQVNLEFKNRNLLVLYLRGKNSFNSPFNDKVHTLELLNFGKYSRQRYGKAGAAGGVSYVWYLARNNTGLFSFSPFYEFASVYEDKRYYNQSSIGANLAYKFWRFPFPVGINYTYSINDSSQQVSFIFGAQF